jgi:hypothetical protein
VSIGAGYSYVHGFKVFLERIDSYDRKVRTEDEARRKEQERIARDAVKVQTLSKITQGQSAKPLQPQALASEGDLSRALSELNTALTQLNSALVEGQVKLNEGTFDAGIFLNTTLSSTLSQIRETHPEGALREDHLSKQVAELVRKNRPQPKVKEWEAARRRGSTPEILAHYSMVQRISALRATNQMNAALKLARQAASGATTSDAMLVEYLAGTTVDEHFVHGESDIDILRRNLKSPERSWRVQYEIATQMTRYDRDKAQSFLETQFAYFGKAPKLWPDVIAFYRNIGDNKQSKDMATACAIALADYRNACLSAAQTPAEALQAKQKTDAHATVIVEQMKKKFFK